MDLYREEILDHWQNPSNFGQLRDFDLETELVNPLCGDRIKIQIKLESSAHPRGGAKALSRSHPGGVIRDLRFTGDGCAISIASASILSEYIKGKSLKIVQKLNGEDVLNLLRGQERFPPARLKCAFLALEVIKKLNA